MKQRTKQEIRVGMDIIEALQKEVNRKNDFFCSGRAMTFQKELDALVAAFLDGVCHGGPLREKQ